MLQGAVEVLLPEGRELDERSHPGADRRPVVRRALQLASTEPLAGWIAGLGDDAGLGLGVPCTTRPERPLLDGQE